MPTSLRASTLLLFMKLMVSYCHGANNMTQGQTIRNGQTIISSSGTFALGFFRPTNSHNRVLGIWYNKIPVRTVVWVANRENPIRNSSGLLTVASNGNLVLLDGTGNNLWSTNYSGEANNTTALLQDTGNLCLCVDQCNNPGKYLWQSFQYPTDTYLPGMKVWLNPIRGKDVLTSWKSRSDPSRGQFSVGVDPKGLFGLVLWKGEEERWRSGLWNGQIFIGVPGMVGNYLTARVLGEGEKKYFSYKLRNSSKICRFRVRWDGQFQQLFWNERRQKWEVHWYEPDGKCDLYNTCGSYGFCSRSNSRICSCLSGFVPKSRAEWDSGNWSSGCVRKTKLQCGRNISSAQEKERDQFKQVDRVKLPDFADVWQGLNMTQCVDTCLKNCSCRAYAFDNGIQCLTWAQDFVDVGIFQNGGKKLFIRLAASEKGKIKLALVIPTAVGVIFVCISGYIIWRCIAKSGNRKEEKVISDVGCDGNRCEVHSLQDILNATNDFSDSNKLGQGGFGPVYKGMLPGGIDVAVKRLSKKSRQGLQEFKNEVIIISKLQHRNLVRLIGYCIEGEEKILVYEYLPNKSLDIFIFGNTPEELNWVKRFNIIKGIAQGLLYLHRDSRLRIIHRDLKVSNILLDEKLNPKISDFGMAKIFEGEQIQAYTNRAAGTYGYMSPEYAIQGIFSLKSDIYSFGVLLLEIVSGKRNQYIHPEYSTNLVGYAWKLWSEGRAMEFIDPSINGSCSASPSNALRCINVGLLCVQDSAMDRPIISIVLQMLENDIVPLPIPRQPTFTVVTNTTEMLGQSRNSMTNTLVTGR